MRLKEIPKIIKQNQSLLPNNYMFFEEEGLNGLPIILIRKTSKFVFRIGVWIDIHRSYSEYNSTIYFKQIEDVLNPMLVKNKIIGSYSEENNDTILLKTIEPELFEQTLNPSYPKIIETEQDVLDLLLDLKEYTENVAEPFFEKWSDLRVLDEFLDTVPQMEVHKYLGGYGVFSKILIYKLCNNPRYEEYFNFMYSFAINRYLENPDGDIAIKQKRDFMIDFKEVLEKTKPVYNI